MLTGHHASSAIVFNPHHSSNNRHLLSGPFAQFLHTPQSSFLGDYPNEMDPIVPILRFAYLFLNIYDTYKVLKIPAPSARNGGQTAPSAMAQRKRDMKAIITIWTVWVCLLSYPALPLARPDCALFSLDSAASRRMKAQ